MLTRRFYTQTETNVVHVREMKRGKELEKDRECKIEREREFKV